MSIVTVLILLTLIGFNALYVAAEFAAVSVRRSRIRQMAEEGSAPARMLLPVLEDPKRLDRFIAACQVGITISSLVLGAYGQAELSEVLIPAFEGLGGMQVAAAESAAVVVVLVGLTVLQMVLGELVPKSLALQHPTRIALLTVLPMRWSQAVLTWFIAVLNGSGWAILRLVGVEPAGHRHLHSPEEIRFLIAESRQGGFLEPEEEERLDHALELTRRTAGELMVPRTRIVGLERSTPLDVAIERAAAAPYTRLPVYDRTPDDIRGVIHTKDLALARFSGDTEVTLDTLTRPVVAVHEQVTADRLLTLLKEQRGVMAVVVDDFGGTAGLITAEDILTELLGDIADEFKHHDGAPGELPDGRIRLPGSMPVHDACDWVGADWQSDSHTIAGLVMERLGRIAEAGDVLEIDGFQIEIESVERHTVVSLLVRPPAAPAGSEDES